MKNAYLAAPAVALMLAGCQVFCPKPPAPPAPVPNPVIQRATLQQQTLWLDDDINNATTTPSDAIRADGAYVAVDWSGDAIELLSHVARQRGLKFAWVGVRLPLPVNIKVRGITYQNLLRLVEMQTAWRATLHQLPGQLTLAFEQAQPVKRAGGQP